MNQPPPALHHPATNTVSIDTVHAPCYYGDVVCANCANCARCVLDPLRPWDSTFPDSDAARQSGVRNLVSHLQSLYYLFVPHNYLFCDCFVVEIISKWHL